MTVQFSLMLENKGRVGVCLMTVRPVERASTALCTCSYAKRDKSKVVVEIPITYVSTEVLEYGDACRTVYSI